nr:flagellar hook-basal body complex protein [uncultured Eisenbergiella sp.]
MLRSLYSAVSGMKAHQSKLDVIGNNIANVNTYGFKSSRGRFSDVFYQTLQNATGGSATMGGTNASQIGYGTQLAGIDLDMSRSAFQSTNRGLDVAIAGEGFFQVQDSDGNIFYTRAGALQIDPNSGNLTDANGYTVLGVSGDPLGKGPGSNKIHLDIPSQLAAKAVKTETINGIRYTLTSEKATTDANVSVNFVVDDTLPDGADAVVKDTEISTGSITVRVNAKSVFSSLTDLMDKVNTAITQANGGKEYPTGKLSLTAVPDGGLFPAGGLTGAEILGYNFDVVPGEMTLSAADSANNGIFGSMLAKTVSSVPKFTAEGDVEFKAEYIKATADTKAEWKITATVGTGADTRTFVGHIDSSSTAANSVLLKESPVKAGEEAGQYIEMTHEGFTKLSDEWQKAHAGADINTETNPGMTSAGKGTVTASQDSKELGLGQKGFVLEGGTAGGTLSSSQVGVSVLSNGVIEVNHPDKGKIQVGRIDLATFENPYGLEEVGNSYFQQTANSGTAKLCQAGTNGSGALQSSALEMSNVDISSEFSDMIVTQRGFQANSRIITVSDTILEELVNLKR